MAYHKKVQMWCNFEGNEKGPILLCNHNKNVRMGGNIKYGTHAHSDSENACLHVDIVVPLHFALYILQAFKCNTVYLLIMHNDGLD